MKGFHRQNRYLSLCGLNCALCSMHLGNHCPGCGCGPHHSCAIAKCSLEHNCVDYCFECHEYPCPQYEGADEYDSFITHRNQFKDMQKAKSMGIEAYTQEQVEKEAILHDLLENYNAGRQKTFFCIALNLLELRDTREIMGQIAATPGVENLPTKDKAAYAVRQFQAVAGQQGIVLKLRKKTREQVE